MKPIYRDHKIRASSKGLRPRTMEEVRVAFWVRVEKTSNCWKWIGATQPDGYGSVTFHGQRWPAHKFAFFLTHGKVTKGLFILHKCDNKGCVNPDHLYEGTTKDNARDASQRGRLNPHRGESCSTSKLTTQNVIEIRKRYRWYKVPASLLAKEYGVCRQLINGIIARKKWAHVS